MATSELILPGCKAHKAGKDYMGTEEILRHMKKGARRKVKTVSKKISAKKVKVEDSIELDIGEYEFFDADNLNLHVPPVAIEEVEFEVIDE